MKKIVVLLLSVSIGFLACDDHHSYVYVPVSDNYLPLQIGNTWNFSASGSMEGAMKWVDSKKEIDGKEYFLIITVVNCSTCNSYPDSLYMRIDTANGFVYSRKPSDGWENNWYRLEAKNGDEWSYIFDSNETAKVKATELDLTINNAVLKNCKSYYYDVKELTNEEYTRTLAMGIGFIEEHSNTMIGKFILTSAMINGKRVGFEMTGC